MPDNWRSIGICCLLGLSAVASEAAHQPEECGRLLSVTPARGAIYVLCPDLPQLSSAQAFSLVIDVLDGTDRLTGETMILFFSDDSVAERGRWPTPPRRLLEEWGGSFVGVYHTNSQILTVRAVGEDEWLEVFLPTARD